MKERTWRRVSLIAFAWSILFFFAVIGLPFFKAPQSESFWGPTVPYKGGNETLSGYYIPPVDAQKKITITILYFSKASLDITVFATGEGSIAPQGPPLLQERPSGTSFSTEVESTQSQAYGIYIVTYNRTEFLLTVASVWSPFYGLGTFFAPAVAFVFAAGVATYYFTLAAKREEVFEKALTEARGGLGSGKATLLRDRRTLEVSPEHVGVCRGRDQY